MKGLCGAGAALGVLLACAPTAWAQGEESPSVAASAAAGMAFPLHGDFDFNAPEWQLAVRAAASRHFVLEGFFHEWRHSTERTLIGIAVQGPQGVIGHIGRFEQRTEHTTRTMGFNALARGFAGSASFTGGGGAGYTTFLRRFTETISDCESSVPGVCQNRESRFSNGSFSLQGLAGVDVAITSRIAAFGQFQAVMPVNDFGSMHLSVTAGGRVRIW
jgi:hypothetical protein